MAITASSNFTYTPIANAPLPVLPFEALDQLLTAKQTEISVLDELAAKMPNYIQDNEQHQKLYAEHVKHVDGILNDISSATDSSSYFDKLRKGTKEIVNQYRPGGRAHALETSYTDYYTKAKEIEDTYKNQINKAVAYSTLKAGDIDYDDLTGTYNAKGASYNKIQDYVDIHKKRLDLAKAAKSQKIDRLGITPDGSNFLIESAESYNTDFLTESILLDPEVQEQYRIQSMYEQLMGVDPNKVISRVNEYRQASLDSNLANIKKQEAVLKKGDKEDIKTFQKINGIEVTGKYDKATKEFIENTKNKLSDNYKPIQDYDQAVMYRAQIENKSIFDGLLPSSSTLKVGPRTQFSLDKEARQRASDNAALVNAIRAVTANPTAMPVTDVPITIDNEKLQQQIILERQKIMSAGSKAKTDLNNIITNKLDGSFSDIQDLATAYSLYNKALRKEPLSDSELKVAEKFQKVMSARPGLINQISSNIFAIQAREDLMQTIQSNIDKDPKLKQELAAKKAKFEQQLGIKYENEASYVFEGKEDYERYGDEYNPFVSTGITYKPGEGIKEVTISNSWFNDLIPNNWVLSEPTERDSKRVLGDLSVAIPDYNPKSLQVTFENTGLTVTDDITRNDLISYASKYETATTTDILNSGLIFADDKKEIDVKNITSKKVSTVNYTSNPLDPTSFIVTMSGHVNVKDEKRTIQRPFTHTFSVGRGVSSAMGQLLEQNLERAVQMAAESSDSHWKQMGISLANMQKPISYIDRFTTSSLNRPLTSIAVGPNQVIRSKYNIVKDNVNLNVDSKLTPVKIIAYKNENLPEVEGKGIIYAAVIEDTNGNFTLLQDANGEPIENSNLNVVNGKVELIRSEQNLGMRPRTKSNSMYDSFGRAIPNPRSY